MKKFGAVDWVALVLVVVGAVNWGLVGLFSFNIVQALFEHMPEAVKFVYILVGVAGVYVFINTIRCCCGSECKKK